MGKFRRIDLVSQLAIEEELHFGWRELAAPQMKVGREIRDWFTGRAEIFSSKPDRIFPLQSITPAE